MKNLVLCTLTMLAISGCAKKSNGYDNTAAAAALQVPPYTEVGANTFGCTVDGAVWANFGEETTPGTSNNVVNKVSAGIEQTGSSPADSVLTLQAHFTIQKQGHTLRDELMTVLIFREAAFKGTHLSSTGAVQFHYQNYLNLLHGSFDAVTTSPLTITISNDEMLNGKRIISGRFNGVLYNTAKTDSVELKGGVFDVVATTYP